MGRGVGWYVLGSSVVSGDEAKVTCCVGGTFEEVRRKKSENGLGRWWVGGISGGWRWHRGSNRVSPRAALAGAGSQEQGLNVQDTSLVLALALRKA